MANYTAADIKDLREKTGAGMMDVKKALDEAEGDLEKAVEIIRVKGLKGITKREGRSASAGLVLAEVVADGDKKTGYLVEVNAETDFVAKNDRFIAFANQVLAAAVAGQVDSIEALEAAQADGKTVKDLTDEMAAVIGEKIMVRRVAKVQDENVAAYLHQTSKDLPPQVGVLVGFSGGDDTLGRDVAMHIAAYSPTYVSRDDVPADTVENERRVCEETTRAEGKPEAALVKNCRRPYEWLLQRMLLA